jgi:hypothetical protein
MATSMVDAFEARAHALAVDAGRWKAPPAP